MMQKLRTGSRGCGKQGFTLTEIMISFSIFMVLAWGYNTAFIAAMRTHAIAANHYAATCLARNRIQRSKALDFDSLLLLSEQNKKVNGNGVVDPLGLYLRSTIVTQVGPDCTEICVQVNFPARNGLPSTAPVQVKTLVTKGMYDQE